VPSARKAAKLAQATAEQLRIVRYLLEEVQGDLPVGEQIPGFVLKPGEIGVLNLGPVGLLAPSRLPGHYRGGSAGVSVRGPFGTRPRVGHFRGTYVQGAEAQQVVDTGQLVVTTTRAVFIGPRHSMTWPFDKVVGIWRVAEPPSIMLALESRDKVEGLVLPQTTATLPDDAGDVKLPLPDLVHFRIQLALAHHQGANAVQSLRQALQNEADELAAQLPPG